MFVVSEQKHNFLLLKKLSGKGSGDYKAVTLVSKGEGVKSSVQPRSVRTVVLFPRVRL